MEIIYDLNEDHIKQLYELYQQEWWAKGRTFETTRECVSGSQICIALVDSNDLIGFTRVITDYTFKALIFDVIVRVDQRGRGLGNRLVSLVKSHKMLNRVKHFELYCLPDMGDFYRQHGFDIPLEIHLMRCTNTIG